ITIHLISHSLRSRRTCDGHIDLLRRSSRFIVCHTRELSVLSQSLTLQSDERRLLTGIHWTASQSPCDGRKRISSSDIARDDEWSQRGHS
ncbi:hypothetical protein PENTCL1PPCAC_11380, partial [Pristionchus entomophagus]